MNKTKRVIVIGATSGLGRGVAEIYIRRGWRVGVVGRRESLLMEIVRGNENVLMRVCDVTQPVDCIEQMQSLVSEMGGLDLLVLSSGVGSQNAALDYNIELPMIETNVRGWTAIVDWAFVLFQNQGYGHLAAISSIASVRGLAPAPAYSASKAYQAHYLEALRQRAYRSAKPLYVTDIRPGFVDTALLKDPTQFFWVLPQEKAVRAIVKAIDKRRGVATITKRWAMLSPLMRILPNRLMALALVKKAK